MSRAPWALFVCTGLAACGRDAPAEGERLGDLPNQPGGVPLVPDVAMLPYPSDFYLEQDASTVTGRRLVIPQEALPEGIPAELFAEHDGFTRAPAILAWLEGGFDASTLPDLGGSVAADSPVMLVREGDWSLVPVLAELDSTAADPEEQALILRPQVSLDPATGYVVLLRDTVVRADGEPHEPTDAFRALRDDIPTDDPDVESMRDDFALFHEAVVALGLAPSEIVLGWTFHTRSEEQVVNPVLSMHDAMAEADLGDWQLVSDTVEGDNRLIYGTVEVPDFLGDDDVVQYDEAWGAVPRGERTMEFLVTLPVTVAETRPVILFGHGFFSSQEEPTWGSLQQSLQPWEMSTISTDFIGFNEDDAIATVAALSGDFDGIVRVVGQQQQSQAHFTALARLVREQLATDVIEDRGAGPFTPMSADRVVYMGISNGGSQGSVITAASPLIDTAALVVPGGGWSHMLQRAVQWNTLGSIMVTKYPDPLEMQVALGLAQNLLDPVDVLNYAPHLVGEPFPGRSPKNVTLHMAVQDAQVANVVTEWVARSAGIPLVVPAPFEVWGLDTLEAPPPGVQATSGLFVYDEGYAPNPEGNLPPLYDNGAHETIRDLLVYREQVGAFLEDGTLVQVCDGACDPD